MMKNGTNDLLIEAYKREQKTRSRAVAMVMVAAAVVILFFVGYSIQ